MIKTALKYIALTAAIAGLCGCSTTKESNCPLASALVDTSSMTVFAVGDTTAQRPLYTVQIAKVDSDCKVHKYEHTVDNDLDLTFTATRPQAGSAREYNVSYFVAVTEGSRILGKRRYNVHFRFEPDQSATTFTASLDSTQVAIEKGKRAYDYTLTIGLQLTQAQLDYNRTAGRYPK